MQTIGEFEYSLGDLLGHGAFALVFQGRRIKDHQPVAVKQITLKNVPGKLSNIRQKEIEILKDLRHPNIVQLYDYREAPSDVFLIMEYCNGGDLGDYLNAKKTLSEESIRILARHIAGALEVLQAHHIIHRDIKPQNLLLSYPPTSGGTKKGRSFREATIKLADFGFARHLSSTDMAATLCGSPLYMAPEILLGRRYDNKADLWSVGTILFQCLSGTAPFLATNPHALRKKYVRETLVPKIPSGTSHPLTQLLLSLLKKDPRERLSYEHFFAHPFLQDVPLSSTPQLSQHVKSSPVPIRRHAHQPSPRQSISPRRGSSIDTYSLSPSSASGPPLSHQIGSQNSLPYLSAQSPKSDVTDQGFILVDLPASSGSRLYVRSNSLSTSPNSTHTPSSAHTPSSVGSLTRYTSLTTPFYQVPARSNRSPDNEGFPHSSGSTPTNTDTRGCNMSSGYHSRTHGGSTSSLSRSNSGRRTSGTAPYLPFGQLIQHVVQPSTSSPHSHSPHRHSLTGSPLSTPPSQSSNQRAGMKYAHSSHGSGSRLSSLVEERERINQQRQGSQRKKKGSKTVCEDFITQSCLLLSDEEDNGSPEEEENFPLSLNMSFNSSSQSTDEQDGPDVHTEHVQNRPHPTTGHAQSRPHLPTQSSSSKVTITGQDVVRFSVGGDEKIKRSSSFSHQNPQLTRELAAIRKRATTLSKEDITHSDEYTIEESQSPKIGSFQMPFLFDQTYSSSKTSDQTSSRRSTDCGGRRDELRRGGSRRRSGEELCQCLSTLRESLVIGRELVAMAQARQSPIMLLSTSTNLSDSGVGSRVQRCSEQLVLYAKAVSILESSLLVYEINMATKNTEPSQLHKEVEVEVRRLLSVCLEKAKSVKEQLSECASNKQLSQVSAEKLLYLEALDMCKAAVLDEKSGEAKECIKRYRRAKLIFQYLLSNAQSQRDRTLLQKYVYTSQHRVDLLSRLSY